MYSIIITAFKEADTIKIAIEQLLLSDKKILKELEIIVVAPDNNTLNAAKASLKNFKNYKLIKDDATGKANALNKAVSKLQNEILIFTDGDMYVSDNAIELLIKHFDNKKVAGVSGNPRPLNKRNSMFGFFAHLFCDAADSNRRKGRVPMSGYLFAVRNVKGLFPLPKNLKAEDAYISLKLIELGYKIDYEPKAYAYVKFPDNTSDWLKQKTRSLGGNFQLNKYFKNKSIKTRNIFEDLTEIFYPIEYAKNLNEFLYLFYLYPLRLILWFKIIFNYIFNNYKEGSWDRIESTKKL